jgi:hypothetical protein
MAGDEPCQEWPSTTPSADPRHRRPVELCFGTKGYVRLVALPSKADIAPCHFEECHIADRRTGLGFEDVGQIEQIVIAKACNTRLDLVKAFDRGNTAIVIRLIFVLSMRTPTMSILER